MKPFEVLTTEQLMQRLEKYKYKQLHIHHTWKPDHSNFNGRNHLSLQDGMYNYHTQANGWSDIGQHVTLFPDGLWVTGRAFDRDPASIKYWNKNAFAVEMIGNFDKGHDKLEGKQKESLLELSRYFLSKGTEIKFHREGQGVRKTCPGSGIDKNDFMKEVEEEMKTSEIELLMPDGSALEVDGYIVSQTSYLPLREILERLGFKVGWSNGKITISK